VSDILIVHQFGLPQVSGLTVTMAELARLVPEAAGVGAAVLSFDRFTSPAELVAALASHHRDTAYVLGLNLHIEVAWTFTLTLADWCMRTATPLYVHVHDYWPHHRENLTLLAERFGARVLAITPAIAAQLQAHGFAPDLLPAGIAVPAERPPLVPVPSGPPTVGAVGRPTPRKRLPDVVAAFCMAGVDEARLQLVVPPSLVFPPDQDRRRAEEIEREAHRCRRPGAVTVDSTPRPGTDYTGWVAYVSASEYEGLSMTPLEAVLQGRPVILSDIPPHRRMVEALFPDHPGDMLFPVGDRRALADLLQDELATGSRRQEVAVRSAELYGLLMRDWSLRGTARMLAGLARPEPTRP
jgi:glycosyltransferase involved in cell wall biosynthesis